MPTCLNVSKRSFNHRNCICAVDFSRHNVPQMAHNRKENTQTLMQMQIQIRLQIECTTDDDVERERQRRGRDGGRVGAVGGEGVQWTDTHVLLMTTQSVAGMQSLALAETDRHTNTPLHTNSPTRPTVCLATFVDVVVVYIPSIRERGNAQCCICCAEKGNWNFKIEQFLKNQKKKG